MKLSKVFSKEINVNIGTHRQLEKLFPDIERTIKTIRKKIKLGGKLMLCGNGGSAADAQHLSAEYLVRLRPNVNRKPIPAITLAQDTSTLTACGNDYDFSDVFRRPFQALAKKNDVLIAISTSGNSKNIVNVLKLAKKKKIFSIGFLGSKGGISKKYCDLPIIVDSNSVPRIQECHIFLGHFIFDEVEKKLFKK